MIRQLLKKAKIKDGKISLDGEIVEAELLKLSVLDFDPEETEFFDEKARSCSDARKFIIQSRLAFLKKHIPEGCDSYILGDSTFDFELKQHKGMYSILYLKLNLKDK